MSNFIDMDETTVANSDQLNAIDIAEPRDITIRDVKKMGDEKQPIQIFFDGDNGKPFKPCLMMRRLLREMWGRNGAEYVGRSLTIFNQKSVRYGGKEVGGIRISHATHIERDHETIVRPARGVLLPYKVQVLQLKPKVQSDHPAPSNTEDVDGAIQTAQNAASCGTKAFTSWFNSEEGKLVRGLFKDDVQVMAGLKTACIDADAALDGEA